MSFLAKLFLEDKVVTILDCSFSISKDCDDTGKPIAIAKSGQIELVIQVGDTDDFFYGWTGTVDMVKDGRLVFYKNNATAVKLQLHFVKAFCLNYTPQFNSEHGFVANILISAQQLTYGGYTHTNKWGNV